MSPSEQLVMTETIEGYCEVGALVMDSVYDVCIEDIEYERRAVSTVATGRGTTRAG